MMLGKLPVPRRPTNLDYSRARTYCTCRVGAGGGWYGHFFLSSIISFSFETARYRLKYCLKGPLNPKQPTNPAGNYILVVSYMESHSCMIEKIHQMCPFIF